MATWMWNVAEDRSPAGACVFDILRREPLAAKMRQAPYPRLHQLLAGLDGAEFLVRDGRYLFHHPATARLIQLADIP